MKNKQTQRTFVLKHLNRYGKVSRNTCLSAYISRLSDIVFRLKQEGWNLEGRYVKTKYGRDFVYFLTK